MFDLYVMSAAYVVAGILHFLRPRFYLPMMPPYIPWHRAMIAISGVAEIALGLLLLPLATRPLAAWGIILMLIAFLPAHFYMIKVRATVFKRVPAWFLYARLPLQALLMLWAYRFTS